MHIRIVLVLISLLLAACTGQPQRQLVVSPSPTVVASDPKPHMGRNIEWGGRIVASENRRKSTWLEVLAYPLDDEGKPELGSSPIGRFMAVRPGYLETVDFAPSRLVTIKGPVVDLRVGRVGAAGYRFPVVDVKDIRLWAKKYRRSSEPQVHFGIGVGIGL
jgi:outer membrane lipoprotein